MLNDLPKEFYEAANSSANSVLLHTSRVDAANFQSYLFTNPVEILIARELKDIPALFARIEKELDCGRYVAGYLTYECGHHFEKKTLASACLTTSPLPFAWFGVYSAPKIHNPSAANAVTRTRFRGSSGKVQSVFDSGELSSSLSITEREYKSNINAIKRLIEAGDTYQVNFTAELTFPCVAPPVEVFCALMERQPVAYGAYLNFGNTHVVSASPELFFRLENGWIITQPMKGTAPRGKDGKEDAKIAAWLQQDEKNRSENLMIVDLLRNDLGRICKMGTVAVEELFSVERYKTLFQMTSKIRGKLKSGTSYYDIFRALFPCGSVVGAPKVRTMQIIRELEQRSRGIYTGAIGFIAPDGEAIFNVAIRTLLLRDGIAKMGLGSGIVHDSDAKAEYDECRLKAAFVSQRAPEFQLLETILWDREYFLLEMHMERIAASAQYFDFPFDAKEATCMLDRETQKFEPEVRHKVRMLLDNLGTIHIESAILGDPAREVAIVVSGERVNSSDLFLRHKTTNRPLYNRAYDDATHAGFDDALFLNEKGEVTETAIHNIFVEKGGLLLTPPVESGALPGVYRQHRLKLHPEDRVTSIKLEDMVSADRVFVCNSVRGMRQVSRLSTASGTELKSWSDGK